MLIITGVKDMNNEEHNSRHEKWQELIKEQEASGLSQNAILQRAKHIISQLELLSWCTKTKTTTNRFICIR